MKYSTFIYEIVKILTIQNNNNRHITFMGNFMKEILMFIRGLRNYFYLNWIEISFKNISGKYKSEKGYTIFEECRELNSSIQILSNI